MKKYNGKRFNCKSSLNKMSEKVQILDDRTHILQRPDTIVGSVITQDEEVYLMKNGNIILEKIDDFNEALIHIIKEVFDNAADNKNRKWKKAQSYIEIEMTNESVRVRNDGKPLAVEIIEVDVPSQGRKKMYRTESVFDYFRAGTNFDSKEKCICTGAKRNPKCVKCQGNDNIGMNGYGAKATLVFSKYGYVHHGDPDSKQQLTLEFENNHDIFEKNNKGKIVGRKIPPSVKSYKKADSFTEFYFEPDFKRFGLKKFSKNHVGIVHAMAVNLAYVTGLKITFNGKALKVPNLKQLAKLYYGDRKCVEFKSDNGDQVVAMEQSLDEMETYGSRQLSFVNNSCTRNGGIHVRYNENLIGKIFSEWYGNGLKPIDAKKAFIYVVVYNIKGKLTFTSQTKAELKGPTSLKKVNVEKKHFAKIKNWDLYNEIQIMLDGKTQRAANKGVKKGLGKGYIGSTGSNVLDANNAGDSKIAVKKQTTLYLSEGNSAMSFLTDCVDVENNGCIALRGKVPNVLRKKSFVMNEEYQLIRKILGLKMGCKYETQKEIDSLRYGKVIIATDMDGDGLHICSLLNVFFRTQHPGLLDSNFVQMLVTPVIKTTIGKTHYRFYSEQEYKDWFDELDDKKKNGARNKTKYIKGLGGNDPEEDSEFVFNTNFTTDTITFDKPEDEDMVDVFFSDKKKEVKKEILTDTLYNEDFEPSISRGRKPFTKFIKNDFVYTCEEQNLRAIPYVYDGLKESQKDIMYTVLTKLGTKANPTEIKTKRLGALVAETALYHHGEDNVPSTVTKMAQDIIGTNNISFFTRKGSFGSRLYGGNHGAASERYTYVQVNPLMHTIFNPEDFNILEWVEREGNEKATPKYLLPIIPLFLVNNVSGMGNGWSTDSPSHNPEDLVDWVRAWIANNFQKQKEEYPELIPWYRGWEGEMEPYKTGNGWTLHGVIEDVNKDEWIVKEIPAGRWGMQLKLALERIADEGRIEKPKLTITHNNITAHVKRKGGKPVNLHKELMTGLSEKQAGKGKGFSAPLINKISMNNITFIHDAPQTHDCVEEHLHEYCRRRYVGYCDRRKWKLNFYKEQIKIRTNKIRYINLVNDKTINFKKLEDKSDLEGLLEEFEFDLVKDSYDYLTSMGTLSLVKKSVDRLQKEVDQFEEDYNELKATKAWQLWLNELEVFDVEYSKYLEKYPVHREQAKQKKSKKK